MKKMLAIFLVFLFFPICVLSQSIITSEKVSDAAMSTYTGIYAEIEVSTTSCDYFEVTVSLYDLQGRLVDRAVVENGIYTNYHLDPGIYILKAECGTAGDSVKVPVVKDIVSHVKISI